MQMNYVSHTIAENLRIIKEHKSGLHSSQNIKLIFICETFEKQLRHHFCRCKIRQKMYPGIADKYAKFLEQYTCLILEYIIKSSGQNNCIIGLGWLHHNMDIIGCNPGTDAQSKTCSECIL